MSKNKEKDLSKDDDIPHDKINKITESINSILDQDDVELAYCVLKIKGAPAHLVAHKGHFYDIARIVSDEHRSNLNKISKDMGV